MLVTICTDPVCIHDFLINNVAIGILHYIILYYLPSKPIFSQSIRQVYNINLLR